MGKTHGDHTVLKIFIVFKNEYCHGRDCFMVFTQYEACTGKVVMKARIYLNTCMELLGCDKLKVEDGNVTSCTDGKKRLDDSTTASDI